ncbi:MAG: polyprenyl diphosphate synthase [Bacteroidales bacterium]|jgi:undecaprenyl diphosphate synthase|nr:polyprenyl diphosphate synthase [Bacteroidales bacterium]MDD2831414.1 polyprenyl diphosphate synthase [Bacteroidales bacterium]MDD5516577.1 polyprenyl diphosphate synthase [Bacteroidales bacterium]MDY0352886.1 polyprenyl diphosphate synthase [Bacteroidales bacterium]
MEVKIMSEHKDKLPNHVCIIMDGNGRWALLHDMERNEGHRQGVEAVRHITEAAAEKGISYLSLFAFSEENWGRPKRETDALMSLIVDAIHKETPTLMKNNIRCLFMGDRHHLNPDLLERMDQCVEQTADNNRMTLIVAVNYSGKWDILQAVQRMLDENPTRDMPLTQEFFSGYLSTAGIPDPDLMIRTSGEMRISNFMLWQMAYTELYFTPVLWPDFRKPDFEAALEAFSNRERRFGKIEESINIP